MSDLKSHYQTLGLEPTATPEEIKQAYRDLTKVWHPDRFTHDPRLQHKAQEKLKEINRAYEILKNSPPAKQYNPSKPQKPETKSEATRPKSDDPKDIKDEFIKAKGLNYFAPHFKRIIVALVIVFAASFFVISSLFKKTVPSVVSLDWLAKVNPLADGSKPRPTITHLIPSAPGGNLRIYALDVGHGDSLLVISPQGKAVLIDAGPVEASNEVVAALDNHSVRQIDLLIATHLHDDHIGGMKKVIEKFPIGKFLDNGQPSASITYAKLLRELQDNKTPYVKAVRGQSIEIEPGVKFDVYGPPDPPFSASDIEPRRDVQHANSIVLRLNCGSFAMLFTGDAEFETEDQMMNAGANLQANVLKIGLHGSPQATSSSFLRYVAPKFAIISEGMNNSKGNHLQFTLDRLRSANVKIFRTDLKGEIEVFTDCKSHDVRYAR